MKNFLQAASNAAADSVAGPVDLFAFLLSKAGVPIQEPVGGTEWQKRMGLRKDVPQNAASLAGETVGLLSPVVAATKAPQIARGLLQMGENAAAPAKLNKQAGVLNLDLFHGTQRAPDGIKEFGVGDKTYYGAKSNKNAAFWMTSSPEQASGYANWVKGQGNPTVYPVKAQFDKPANLDDLEKLGIYGNPEIELYKAKNLTKLKKAGFDGVVWDLKSYTGQLLPNEDNIVTAVSLFPEKKVKSKFQP